MFADEFRRAALAAPRDRLDAVTAALWKAFAAGGLSEDEAGEIAALVESRRKVAAPTAPRARPVPRSRAPDSVERKRRLAASGWLPPRIASRFTQGEAAALAVVAREVAARGACTLCHENVAALAGVGRTTVRNALRQARLLGLVAVTERRLSAHRSETNVVRVLDPSWVSWLSLRGRAGAPRGGGVREATPTYTQLDNDRRQRRAEPVRKGHSGRSPGAATATLPPRFGPPPLSAKPVR